MKVTERLGKKVTTGVNSIAKKIVVQNANSACMISIMEMCYCLIKLYVKMGE